MVIRSLIAALILVPALGLAADSSRGAKGPRSSGQLGRAGESFRHADTDGDGAISRAEAEKHAPRLAQKFDRIDTNKDGRLTQDELRAYREARRMRKYER